MKILAILLAIFCLQVHADEIVYLNNGIIKVGVNLTKGGSITEISHLGFNVVDDYDTGRYVQAALYDDTGIYGWNPVQGGNNADVSSGYLASFTGTDTWGGDTWDYVASSTAPLYWNAALGVSDVIINQRVSLSRTHPLIRVQWQVENSGPTHAPWRQEYPAVYVKNALQHMYSSGNVTTPWTSAAVVEESVPYGSHSKFNSNEFWAHYAVDATDKFGLMLFTEDDGPLGPFAEFYASRTDGIELPNYMAPDHVGQITSGVNTGAGVWLMLGNLADNRALAYALHALLN